MLRENPQGQVIEIKTKWCKRGEKIEHGPFIVDARLAHIQCRTCGELLNPIAVLIQLSRSEDTLKHRVERLGFQAEKAASKNRTKCEHCQRMTKIDKKHV